MWWGSQIRYCQHRNKWFLNSLITTNEVNIIWNLKFVSCNCRPMLLYDITLRGAIQMRARAGFSPTIRMTGMCTLNMASRQLIMDADMNEIMRSSHSNFLSWLSSLLYAISIGSSCSCVSSLTSFTFFVSLLWFFLIFDIKEQFVICSINMLKKY